MFPGVEGGAYEAAQFGRGLTFKTGVFAIDDAVGAIEAADAAAFAVSASTYSADEATFAVSAATSAARALAIGDSSTNAADAFWSAVSTDATRVEEGARASVIAGSQLCPQHLLGPEPLMSLWNEMDAALRAEKQNWMVWTTWYHDRLVGYVREYERELAYVQIDDVLWNQGPAIVNAEIKRRIEVLERATPVPPKPPPELGPVLQVTERGLELIEQPSEGDVDEVQKALHDRLRRLFACTYRRNASSCKRIQHLITSSQNIRILSRAHSINWTWPRYGLLELAY